MFPGSFVALVTPFRDDKIDFPAFSGLLKTHLMAQTAGVVVAGTTGESFALTHAERSALLTHTVENLKGHKKIIMGCSALGVHAVIDYIQQATAEGADAVLVLTPFYIRASQDEIADFFTLIHNATNIPLIIYNNCARTHVDINIDIVRQLSRLPRIAGIKDASTHPLRISQLCALQNDQFTVYCGEDSMFLNYVFNNVGNIISVLANLEPNLCDDLWKAWHARNLEMMNHTYQHLLRTCLTLADDVNPVAVKYQLSLKDHCANELRSPLRPLAPSSIS